MSKGGCLPPLRPQAAAFTPEGISGQMKGLSEPDHAADIGGHGTGVAIGADRAGIVALGQTFPFVVADKAVVVVGGGWKAKDVL